MRKRLLHVDMIVLSYDKSWKATLFSRWMNFLDRLTALQGRSWCHLWQGFGVLWSNSHGWNIMCTGLSFACDALCYLST